MLKQRISFPSKNHQKYCSKERKLTVFVELPVKLFCFTLQDTPLEEWRGLPSYLAARLSANQVGYCFSNKLYSVVFETELTLLFL